MGWNKAEKLDSREPSFIFFSSLFPSGPASPRVLKKSAAPFQTALHIIGPPAPMQSPNPSVALLLFNLIRILKRLNNQTCENDSGEPADSS